MNDAKLNRTIQSIGKRCFENCYQIACEKREHLKIEHLIEHDPKLAETKESGLRTRLNCIKRIMRADRMEDALKIAKNRRRRK